ncbi:hypothetical protein [Lysinibacillus antri]|uniref:Uncharacterized protein n=1 Tax=Lysinibacillus antri TaxID=2498145 RepID=A0A432L7F3_9BACI|nr:hypothetical protein [Lysinibacillus antri]RUL47430.1 hypothetical protein EK386_18095 [Lysinibacillus antri]
MGIHRVGEYEIAIKFIGVQSRMAVWEYLIKKDGQYLASSEYHPTSELDERKALLEIALDGLFYVGKQLDELERRYSKKSEPYYH